METEIKDVGKGYAETIAELIGAINADVWPIEIDGEMYEDQDAVYTRICEIPISVLVRGGWCTPADLRAEPVEYELLLGTGGPACRIVGELNCYGEAYTAEMEWQDRGTPWTPTRGLSEAEYAAILQFAQCFCFAT